MGWKEFAASIFATALSWPVAFIVAVLIFYKPLKHLIGRVRSGKVAGVEFEIREELRDASTAARKSKPQSITLQGTATVSVSPPPAQEPQSEAEISVQAPPGWDTIERVENATLDESERVKNPFDRMYYVWGRLEESLRQLYDDAVVGSVPHFLTVDRATEVLYQAGLLDEEFVGSVASLRAVLDEISSSGLATHQTARKFVKAAARLRGIVERQIEFYARARR